GRTKPRGQSTNLRMWETIAGTAPIVFGLLLTMNAATLTCRATRGPPTSSILGGVGRGGALFSFLCDLQGFTGTGGGPFLLRPPLFRTASSAAAAVFCVAKSRAISSCI